MVALLVVNDWLLKPRFPGAVVGKLSDLAGLAFAPLALSAAIGLALAAAARLGAAVDPSLTRRRLLACIAATGAGFAAVKLLPALAAVVADALSRLGRRASFHPDLSDLLALPTLAIAWWIGRDELRRVPLGRPAAIARLRRPAGPALADVVWAGARADAVATLATALDAGDDAAADAQLAAIARRAD